MKTHVYRIFRLVTLFALAGVLAGCAKEKVAPATPVKEGAAQGEKNFLHASQADMQWWTEARFGMFIHWGPVSIKGTEIGWSRGGERRGTGGTGEIPLVVSDNLYKEFNPTNFNAKQWVAVAKAAGMQYLVFTTKHHDGFCEFDSKLTDYKVTRSPLGRDVVKELAEACHKAGLRLGFYYSPPDWHHPDYRTDDHVKYVAYMHGQLQELCTKYGKVDVIWFDGLGGKAEDWDAENLFRKIRQRQPHIILNNRAGLSADFDTPEQEIGKFQNTRPWESCITICNQWSWKPGDKMKTLEQCLQTLIRCAGGDGNLLFNVGPMPTGEIEPRQVERLKEMGAWLKKYGDTIYDTRGGPFKPGPWGASTCRRNKVYVHVLKQMETLTLPAIEKKIVRTSVLTGGKAEVTQSAEGVKIAFAKGTSPEIDQILVLELDGPASEIAPRTLTLGGLPHKSVKASNVFQKMRQYGADKAVDDDPDTRWATDGGTKEAWLEVDLGQPQTFDRVLIEEAYAGRVKKFELQWKDGDEWRAIFSGTTLGEHFTPKFPPVTAQVVRLNILEASDGPTISEFRVFAVGK